MEDPCILFRAYPVKHGSGVASEPVDPVKVQRIPLFKAHRIPGKYLALDPYGVIVPFRVKLPGIACPGKPFQSSPDPHASAHGDRPIAFFRICVNQKPSVPFLCLPGPYKHIPQFQHQAIPIPSFLDPFHRPFRLYLLPFHFRRDPLIPTALLCVFSARKNPTCHKQRQEPPYQAPAAFFPQITDPGRQNSQNPRHPSHRQQSQYLSKYESPC